MINRVVVFRVSTVIRHIINNTVHRVINIDKLTYAGNLESLTSIERDARYTFEQVDICDANEIKPVFNEYQPDILSIWLLSHM